MKVLFRSALFDSSGYGEASRNYVLALISQGFDLSLLPISFENWKTEMDSFRSKVFPYIRTNQTNIDVEIVHLTPDNFSRFPKIGKKRIGLTVWETSIVPASWVEACNKMDEIWVPCDWNKTIFESSGVSVPVKVVPHCIDLNEFKHVQKVTSIEEQIPKDRFNFYSIFQWSSRKNPEGLLKAYLSEFTKEDKVNLVLKTYFLNNSKEDQQQIVESIKRIKAGMSLDNTPTISLLHGGLSRSEMLTIHSSGDCFVLPHRAEGWGVPHFEAMAMGKPVISSNYSGNLEFMNKTNSLLVDCTETPVFGMGRSNYNGKMMWGEPDLSQLKTQMRFAYENKYPGAMKIMLDNSQQDIQKFTIENVGILIRNTLESK